MTIDKAARATRAYFRSGKAVLTSDGTIVTKRITGDEAQAACDRLNLIAVLEAVKDYLDADPDDLALAGSAAGKADGVYADPVTCCEIFEAMIDALTAEAKEQQNA